MTTITAEVTYLPDAIVNNDIALPAQYALDAETGAVIVRVDMLGKTASVTLHADHAHHAAALAALRLQDQQSLDAAPACEIDYATWDAERVADRDRKRAERAAFAAAKQARKDAKPLPEWAGESIHGNGFTVRYDTFHRDTMLIFDAVPLPAVRELVKASGFFWAPSKGAWVRGLNAKGKRAAEELAPKLVYCVI